MKKAIRVEIFKPQSGDCSNGGITSRYHDILIEHPEGFIDFDEKNRPKTYVKL